MGSRIMIIAEEMAAAGELAGAVQHLGYDVCDSLLKTPESMDAIAKCAPDVVLIDVAPGRGQHALAAVTRFSRQHSVPIVMISADSIAETGSDGDACPYAVLARPAAGHDLRAALDCALQRSHLDRLLEHCRQQRARGNTQLCPNEDRRRQLQQRRTMEERLQQSEARFRAVVEQQHEWICRFRPDRTVTFTNYAYHMQFCARHCGDAPDRFEPWLSPPDTAEADRLLAGITPAHPGGLIEKQILFPDEGLRWTRWTFTGIFDDYGRVIEYQAVGCDIQQLKELQLELSREQELIQSMFNGISDPFFLMSNDMVIRLANQATLEYFRVQKRPAIGMTCYQAFRGRDSMCTDCRLALGSISSYAKTFERESLVHAGRIEQVTVYPLTFADGDRSRRWAAVHVRDITRVKLLEKKVAHSERLASLGLLVGAVTHEINNPNNFISFNLPILREYLDGIMPVLDEHYRGQDTEPRLFGLTYSQFRQDMLDLIDNMQHGSRRIAQTVAGMRELIREDKRADIVAASLADIASKAAMLCGAKLKNRVRTVSLVIPEDYPALHTDPATLERILIILLVNAAEAADKEDASVVLEAALGADWQERFVIEVRDNGCGIAPEHIEKIFDPFFTTRPEAGGTGLGLYLCRDMVESLGGRVRVNSRIGAGTTVRLALPDLSR